MKKPKIYVDGQAGTTGLQIVGRLKNRDDLILLTIDEDKRHDDKARHALMQEADLVFLCLPDCAAKEAVSLMEDCDTKIIDASTAHRTCPEWTYGFPELSAEHKQAIRDSKKTANPGCHASGFIALVYPLKASGVLKDQQPLSCFSLTGYSGGGKKMIADYESNKTEAMESPRPYGLDLCHKHLPEMKAVCSLKHTPLFVPVVDDYERGMLVSVFVPKEALNEKCTKEDLISLYENWYKDTPVHIRKEASSLYANELAGTDGMELFVNGHEEGLILSARFDNLGKGASGAAIQNMNLMLGLDEYAGLRY